MKLRYLAVHITRLKVMQVERICVKAALYSNRSSKFKMWSPLSPLDYIDLFLNTIFLERQTFFIEYMEISHIDWIWDEEVRRFSLTFVEQVLFLPLWTHYRLYMSLRIIVFQKRPIVPMIGTWYYYFFILVCEAIGTAATPGLLCQPRVIVWRWLWRSRWYVDWQGEPKFSEKPCTNATFVHHKIAHD
jgi:hypothetical protein